MNPVSLRPATVQDMPSIAAIIAASFSDEFGEAWQPDDLPAVMSMPGSRAEIAWDNHVPTGFHLWRQTLDEAELLLIAVRPQERGRGLGRQLLSSVVQAARASGVTRLFLEVREGNLAARNLYQKLGFEAVGRRVRYYRGSNGCFHDALTMCCALDPSAFQGCQHSIEC